MIHIQIRKRVKTNRGEDIAINASFNSNAVTLIFGPSGVGKTTLLKIIAGLAETDTGKIIIEDEVWLDTEAGINLSPQKRKVGFVFQDYALFPNMTVLEHLKFGTDDIDFIEQLLALGRLEDFRAYKPKHLSGGQQQRLAILRALSIRPRLLLMDEPFSALDRRLRTEIMRNLKLLLAKLHTTCLVVTHFPSETDDFAEYSFEMDNA